MLHCERLSFIKLMLCQFHLFLNILLHGTFIKHMNAVLTVYFAVSWGHQKIFWTGVILGWIWARTEGHKVRHAWQSICRMHTRREANVVSLFEVFYRIRWVMQRWSAHLLVLHSTHRAATLLTLVQKDSRFNATPIDWSRRVLPLEVYLIPNFIE